MPELPFIARCAACTIRAWYSDLVTTHDLTVRTLHSILNSGTRTYAEAETEDLLRQLRAYNLAYVFTNYQGNRVVIPGVEMVVL